MGIFGGFCGELIRFIQRLLINLEERQQFEKTTDAFTNRILQTLLDAFLTKGSFELAIDEDIIVELSNMDAPNALEAFNTFPKEKQEQILEITKRNLNGLTLNIILNKMRENESKLINRVIDFILKYALETEKGCEIWSVF